MKLIVFSNFFPYKNSEPFLVTEFKVAQTYFPSISLFTLYGNQNDYIIKTNDSITCYNPVLASSKNKTKLFLKGIFNLAPIGFHAGEFIKKKIFLSPKKTYWCFVSTILIRTVLSSPAYKKLIKDLKQSGSVTLYFYWGDNLCWIIPYLQKQLGKNSRIIIRLHGSDLYESIKADYAPLRANIFEIVQSIYTVSEYGKNYLTNRYPLFSEKIQLSRLGVQDYGLNLSVDQKQKVVVSVSNLIPLKRVHLIFEALQLITTEITWHHFGDGPLMTEMISLASKARQGLQVKFHGYVKNEEIMNFYKNNPVNTFINVSTSEGLPVSIMEAFSFGIPVIATDVGGTSELVNSKTGILLNKDFAISELSVAIGQLINAEKSAEGESRKNARAAYIEKVSLTNYEVFYSELNKGS